MLRHLSTLLMALVFCLPASTRADAHGCHRKTEKDGRGWHYHEPDGDSCHRIEAPDPSRHQIERAYTRTPTCRRVCHFVDTVRTCRVDCQTTIRPGS